jgi:hypothetical protein
VIDEILAAARGSAGPAATEATIVGSWHRAQTCDEMLAMFEAAGLAESHRGWLQGNFFGGSPGPSEGDACAGGDWPTGARPLFTDDGQFGSHDENGEEVDHGDYQQVDDDTLSFPSHASEFGYDSNLTVDYEIADDVVTFSVVLPDGCADACADAYAWALFRIRLRTVEQRRSPQLGSPISLVGSPAGISRLQPTTTGSQKGRRRGEPAIADGCRRIDRSIGASFR